MMHCTVSKAAGSQKPIQGYYVLWCLPCTIPDTLSFNNRELVQWTDFCHTSATEAKQQHVSITYLIVQRSAKRYANLAKQDPGRTGKQEQERISPNHIPTIFHFSVFLIPSLSVDFPAASFYAVWARRRSVQSVRQ